MRSWWFSLQSIEGVIFLTSNRFFCFGGVVSNSWGSTDTSSCINNTILWVFDEFGKYGYLFFEGFISVLELIGLDRGVTGSGYLVTFGDEFGLFPLFVGREGAVVAEVFFLFFGLFHFYDFISNMFLLLIKIVNSDNCWCESWLNGTQIWWNNKNSETIIIFSPFLS